MKPQTRITTVVDVDNINIERGMTVTMWLVKNAHNEPRDAVQVELRVSKDGTPEIFTDGIKAKYFEDWKPFDE